MVAVGEWEVWNSGGGHRNRECLETQVVVKSGVGGNSKRGELELELRQTHLPHQVLARARVQEGAFFAFFLLQISPTVKLLY